MTQQLKREKISEYNNSYSGCDMTAIMTLPIVSVSEGKEKVHHIKQTLGSLQTISYSTHMERKPIRRIGDVNAIDYVMGPRTIAGSLVFAVFDKHFAHNIMEKVKSVYGTTKNILVDELPPFDITITLANEYGTNSVMRLGSVRLINEGQVMSINDLYIENTYQFVATDLEYIDNYSLSKNTDQKVIGNNSIEIEKENPIGNPIKELNKSKSPIYVTLSVNIFKSNNYITPITISLNPDRKSGEITILDNANNKIKSIKVKGGEIREGLLSGNYSIAYKDTGVYSDIVYINIKEKQKESNAIETPIVNRIRDDYVIVPNLLKETKIEDEKELTDKNIKISYSNNKIFGLKKDKEYYLYNDKNNKVLIKTDSSPNSDIYRIKERALNSYKQIEVDLISEILDKAENMFYANRDRELCEILYDIYIEYKKEKNEELALMSSKIINLSCELLQQKVISNNYSLTAPISIDQYSGRIKLDNNSTSVKIQKIPEKTNAPIIKDQKEFINIKNSLYIDLNKNTPGLYKLKALDITKKYSAISYVYIEDKNLNSSNYVKFLEEQELTKKVESDLEYQEGNFKERKYYNYIKYYNKNMFYMPELPIINNKELIFNTDFIEANKGQEYKLCIVKSDLINYKEKIIKRPFNYNIKSCKINDYDMFIDGSLYSCWIEDTKNNQISNLITFSNNNQENSLYMEDIKTSFVNKIKEMLIYKNIKESLILSILSEIDGNSEISINNVYKELIQRIVLYKNNINNYYDLIKMVISIKNSFKSGFQIKKIQELVNIERNTIKTNKEFKYCVNIISKLDGSVKKDFYSNLDIDFIKYSDSILEIYCYDDEILTTSNSLVIDSNKTSLISYV